MSSAMDHGLTICAWAPNRSLHFSLGGVALSRSARPVSGHSRSGLVGTPWLGSIKMVLFYFTSLVLAFCGGALMVTAQLQHATIRSAWAEIILGSAALLAAGFTFAAASHVHMIELATDAALHRLH
jgi:hypothetical protein